MVHIVRINVGPVLQRVKKAANEVAQQNSQNFTSNNLCVKIKLSLCGRGIIKWNLLRNCLPVTSKLH